MHYATEKETAMQVEILKFLLDASAHLDCMRREKESGHLDDLQAVERTLPDTDWYESIDESVRSRRFAGGLWPDRFGELEF